MKIDVCKNCPDNNYFDGCLDHDCEVYQDIKADNILQDNLDNMEENELGNVIWEQEKSHE